MLYWEAKKRTCELQEGSCISIPNLLPSFFIEFIYVVKCNTHPIQGKIRCFILPAAATACMSVVNSNRTVLQFTFDWLVYSLSPGTWLLMGVILSKASTSNFFHMEILCSTHDCPFLL